MFYEISNSLKHVHIPHHSSCCTENIWNESYPQSKAQSVRLKVIQSVRFWPCQWSVVHMKTVWQSEKTLWCIYKVGYLYQVDRHKTFFFLKNIFRSIDLDLRDLCIGKKNSTHSSEIRGLRPMKCSSKTLQNLLYFMYRKTLVLVFFVFHFVQLCISTLRMPWTWSMST